MYDATISIVLALVAVIGTTIFHLEALMLVGRFERHSRQARILVPVVLLLVIAAHLAEISGYALIYWIAIGPLDMGSLTGQRPTWLDMFYFSAETYSSLGSDNIMPHGALRLIVAIGSINGILLLSWSRLAGLSRDAVMPKVTGTDLLSVRADVGVFLLLASLDLPHLRSFTCLAIRVGNP